MNSYIKEVDDLTPLEREQLSNIQREIAKGTMVADYPNYWYDQLTEFWHRYDKARKGE